MLNGEKKVAYAVCNLNLEKNSDIFFIIRDNLSIYSKKN